MAYVIPKNEYFERIAKFQARIKAAGLDACLVHGTESDFANVRYLSEYWPTFEQAGVFVPAEGDAVLLIGPESYKYAVGRSVLMEFTTIHWRRISFRTISRVILILLCIVVSVYVDSQIPGNNYEAHVGGLCLGAMIGMAWYFKQLRKTREKRYEN